VDEANTALHLFARLENEEKVAGVPIFLQPSPDPPASGEVLNDYLTSIDDAGEFGLR